MKSLLLETIELKGVNLNGMIISFDENKFITPSLKYDMKQLSGRTIVVCFGYLDNGVRIDSLEQLKIPHKSKHNEVLEFILNQLNDLITR